MVGADRFVSVIPLCDSSMTDFRKLLLNSWFQFQEKNLLAEHPSMKKDFRAVRWKSKGQMLNELLSWFLFWVTAFTRKAGMPLYLRLNLQLSNWREIWISVQLSTCNTWKITFSLVSFLSLKVARTKEWGVLTNNWRWNVFPFWQVSNYERIYSNSLFTKENCNESPRSLQLGKGLKLALLKITVPIKGRT